MNQNNQKALNATKNQNAVAYSNNVIDMTLNSKRKDTDEHRPTFDPITNEVIDWSTLTKAEERELYSFVARHAYIQDIIANVITVNKEYIKTDDPDFYSITLTREGVEYFGTDGINAQNHDLWTNILYLAQHPTGLKSVPIKINDTEKGRIILTPYVIKVTYGEDEIKKELQIRKTYNNAPQQKIREVRIMFAKYLYKDLYEQGQNFTKLGKCLFAKIKHLISYWEKDKDDFGNELDKNDLKRYRAFLTEEEITRFTKWGENPLQPIQIYKAILYFARYDNGKSGIIEHDLIDFCNAVEPGVLRPYKKQIFDIHQKDEYGFAKCIGEKDSYTFKESYYKEKLKADIYTRFFNILAYHKQITGMRFTSCKAYIDKENMKLRIEYERHKN